MEDGKKIAVWTLDDELDKLSPLYQPHFDPLHSGSEDEWKILAGLYDGLLNMNPYNQYDTPWIALDWTMTETLDGMEIDFTLRNDVYWQDGTPFTAYDIEFCLEFLRDYQVPRYAETWGTLVDVVVTDATHFTIAASEEGLALFYDFADIAALLPPQVWDRTWPSNQAVLDYDPAEPYNVAPGYSPGPTPTPTNLFGTGPWVFQFYDPVNLYSDVWENSNYFVSAVAIDDLLTEMFWEVGDLNRDGIINVIDLTLWSFIFGFMIGEPQYDADADLNSDGIIDILDGARIAFHLGWQREYP
jgi:ABC-type transport system substrate-binding protein